MKENPNYYAIIPATIRYDKDLKPNEKLLYSEITALANKTGVCFATNNYFAQLYNVDKLTVSRWLKNLKDKKYIKIINDYQQQHGTTLKRAIMINGTPIIKRARTFLPNKYTTPVPDWFNKEITADLATPEEIAELEEIIKNSLERH